MIEVTPHGHDQGHDQGQGHGQGPENILQIRPQTTQSSVTDTGKKRKRPNVKRRPRNGSIQRNIKRTKTKMPPSQRMRGQFHQVEGQDCLAILPGGPIPTLALLPIYVTHTELTDQGQTEGGPHPVHQEIHDPIPGQGADPIPEVAQDQIASLGPPQGLGQEVDLEGLLPDPGHGPALAQDMGQVPEVDPGPDTGHHPHVTGKGQDPLGEQR